MKHLPFFLIAILLFGCIQPQQSNQSQQPNTTTGLIPTSSPPDIVKIKDNQSTSTIPSAPQPPASSTPTVSQLKSEEIIYNSDGWDIHGTLYDSKNPEPTKAIILVPALGKTRTSYPQSLISKLYTTVPYAMVLAIDMRGHGESTNFGTWQSFELDNFKNMKNDILNAKTYFKSKHPTVKEYYVVGASIGSTAAILAGAQDSDVVKVAMLSPGMAYKNVEIDRAVDDYLRPLLLVAASDDSYSSDSAEEIYYFSPATQKTLKIYDGSAHGTDLFEATNDTEPLEEILAKFLK